MAVSRRDRVILFLKDFRAGRVKTRLAARLGDQGALEMYRAMVADLFANLESFKDVIVPYIDSIPELAESASSLSSLLVRGKLKIQKGRDLGERMSNAFREVFSTGVERAVLVGSDIPEIDGDLLEGYFKMLRTFPMAIGPAADGGYYLIGFQKRCFDPRLFRGVEWSTDLVFEQTLEKARSLKLPCYVGQELQDVDTIEDLESILSSGFYSRSLTELISHYLVEAER
jgi:rSAM/selenodomain-associated transferase 1